MGLGLGYVIIKFPMGCVVRVSCKRIPKAVCTLESWRIKSKAEDLVLTVMSSVSPHQKVKGFMAEANNFALEASNDIQGEGEDWSSFIETEVSLPSFLFHSTYYMNLLLGASQAHGRFSVFSKSLQLHPELPQIQWVEHLLLKSTQQLIITCLINTSFYCGSLLGTRPTEYQRNFS